VRAKANHLKALKSAKIYRHPGRHWNASNFKGIMNTPTVSLIVPSYNSARYLKPFCESILAQTYHDFEVLVGDDGSSDNSVEILQPFLRDPRFRLIRWQPNRGMHFGVTTLLNVARGHFWCPPGTDDILEPQFLERRVPWLESHPEAVLIHGPADWIDENDKPYVTDNTRRALPEMGGRLPESMPAERMLRILLQHNILNWPSTLVRMDITRLVMPFYAPYWRWTMDWMLWIMLAAMGCDFLWDAKPMIKYRMHSQSLSGSPQKEIMRQIERKLTPLYALRTASLISPLAKSIWIEQRLALYRWWLITAAALRWKGALKPVEMLFARESYRGALPRSVSLWRELAVHGLPALLQYQREKEASRHQLFQVSGFSLIDDPLFRSA
jgi:glycosyltransferase involved in cell wall biosynthesis